MSASTTVLPFVLPFQSIAPHLAVGAIPPSGWRAIGDVPLVILVGVTGVGKSTLLNEMTLHDARYLLLPDRRDLTDQLIISTMQAAEELPIAPVTDRGQRFAYTRRYRELHPGGVAHALAQLWISDDAPAPLLLFDGLRGANEVTAAATTLPHARFVMLDAPDVVRLQRLLGRGDAFDHIQVSGTGAQDATTFAALGLPEAATIFNADDEATIMHWLQSGKVTTDALRAKLKIVIEERQSYDPTATLTALRAHAKDALLYIDTVTHAPDAVASQVIGWLNL